MQIFESNTIRMILSGITGGMLGFGYYRFIGCRSGTCPITKSPYISTIYGAVLGLLWYLK